MKTKALIVLIMGAVVAIVFAIRASSEIHRHDAATAELATQRAALRASVNDLAVRLRAAEAALAVQSGNTVALSAEPPRDVGTVNEPAAKPGTLAEWNKARMLIANDPKAVQSYLSDFRESLDLLYGGMFKALGLSPDQIERFKQMKVAVEQRRMDLHAAVEAQGGFAHQGRQGGLKISSEGYQVLRKEEVRARMQAEAELFGPLEESYRTYYRTNYVRATVARLASTEVYPDLPLNSGQVERVTQILDGHSLRKPGEFFSWNHWPTINWTAAAAQLQSILSPTQFANLRAVVQREEVQGRLVQRRIDLDAEFRKQQRRKG